MSDSKPHAHRPHGADKWFDDEENERRQRARALGRELRRAMGFGLLVAAVLTVFLAAAVWVFKI